MWQVFSWRGRGYVFLREFMRGGDRAGGWPIVFISITDEKNEDPGRRKNAAGRRTSSSRPLQTRDSDGACNSPAAANSSQSRSLRLRLRKRTG